MENPLKVLQKINELNSKELRDVSGQIIPQWTSISGYFALTGFEFGNGSPNFNPGFGVPVKVFMNTRTGEIKTFSANHFEG